LVVMGVLLHYGLRGIGAISARLGGSAKEQP
jgi:hypothetical protein